MGKNRQTSILILMLQIYNILLISPVSAVPTPEFYYNFIHQGGSNGGVRLTLKGRGFAKNQFNFGVGNDHLGNKVVLASDTNIFPCDIHPDGNTETQITCYTRPMPEGRYYIRVSVDGELIPDAKMCGGRVSSSHCTHQVWNHYTPILNELSSISGPPGSTIKMTGRIFTTRFGSNLGPASNSRSEEILRIYAGGNTCELKDIENDKFYGIALTSYNWGYMNCKLQGRFVGSFNISFLISGRFGRSLPRNDLLKVSTAGKIYLFQTYAEILSIYPKEGSVMGGTLLTIKGRNFDETTSKARVLVGDTLCVIEKPVTDDTIVCRVASKPATLPTLHAGNRGLHMESWTTNVGRDINNIFALNASSPTYNRSWIDKGEFYASGEFGARIYAFFQPMYDGKHKFSVSTHGYKQIRLSNNESKASAKLVDNGHVAYLSKHKRYYLEIAYINSNYRKNDIIQLQIFSFNSSVNNQETGLAQNARQQFSLCVQTVKEIQVIKLDNLTEQASVDEIQELSVSKPSHVGEDAMFKLIFGGTATVPLSSKSTPLEVQKALEGLPIIGIGNIAVTANFTVNSATYFIFLKLDLGNLPLIGVETISDKNGNNLTVSVEFNFNGTASNKQFAFYLDNVMSPALSVDASAQMVKHALDEMFSVRCQNFITGSDKNTIFRNDFELSSDSSHNGEKIYDRVPFCGKGSVKNPKHVFWKKQIRENVFLENYPTMCAAFRGDANVNLEVKFMYRLPSSTSATTKTQNFATYLTHIEDWKYICFDILKSVKVQGAVIHLLESINIRRISVKEDLYMDSIILTKIAQQEEPLVLTKAMVRQLPPLSNKLAVKDLHVKKLGWRMYEVTLTSYNCMDNLPIFKTLPEKLTPNGSEMVTNTPADQLPAGVWRLQAASPPLGGSFRLLINNDESPDIPVWSSKKEVEYYLEAIPTMGEMNVDVEGNCSCKTYKIEWLTNPGHKDLLTLNTTNITGINVTASARITHHGGYHMKPVPGEHFRTIHKKTQVTAFINEIRTALAPDGDASFEWKQSATPTITNVNPSQGPVPINLTITGSGFNSDIFRNSVTIDGQNCTILQTSSTQMICTLSSCSMGVHEVIAIIDDKGTAQAIGNTTTFTGTAKILSVNPSHGSYEGGTQLTIKGYGFNHEMLVQMDDDYCKNTAITSSEINCITPAQKNSSQTGRLHIKLNNKKQIESGANFTFITPAGNVTQVNVSMAKVTGGEPILLTGTNLESSSHLEIGHVPANILSSNATNVLAIMPAQGPGVHGIHLTLSNGYAAISGPFKSIDQTLFVNSVNPRQGSLFGGTRLTITGKGFDVRRDLIKITVGLIKCNIEDFSNSWITCMLEHTSKTYDFINPGIHPEYRKGTKEKLQRMHLKVGDSIRWVWSVPIWLRSTDFHVYQIDNLFSNAPVKGGFKSGNKSNNDVFIHQFTRPGTYYFWGGAVDLTEGMRGVISVKPRRSHSEIVNITVGNFEAEYRFNNTVSASLPPRDNCSAQDFIIDYCDENGTLDYPNKFNFHFSECSTSIVSFVSPNQLTSMDEIVLNGRRFSPRQCENNIEFGKHLCVSKTQSASRLTCFIDIQNLPPVGVLLPLRVRLDNRGYALIDIVEKDDRSIVLLPHMHSITPKMGSSFGGTKLTIRGGGFHSDNSTVQVFIGSNNCKIRSVNYTDVICETLPGKGTEFTVQLVVSRSGHKIPATCKVRSNCTYSYSGIITPNVTDVSPTNVSNSGVQFTIKGRGFGNNIADISVTIGTTNCQTTKVTHSHITCQAGYIGAGWNYLKVHRASIGNMAVGRLRVWSHPYISKVHPPIGSLHGGTLITIYGNGFVRDHTIIKIGKKECKILMTNETQVQCSTQPNSMGIQLLTVTSNGQVYVPHIFICATSHTPSIVSISQSIGKPGNGLTIIGSGFINETYANTVTVGDSVCTVVSANANSLNCTLGHQTAGKYPVTVYVDGKGLTNKNIMFTYQLSVADINPTIGSLFGGQSLTLTGSGFDVNQTKVMICSRECLNQGLNIQNDTMFMCVTPRLDDNSTSDGCVVNVSVGNFHAISSQVYQYSTSKTAKITQVYPARGGTKGGTTITITGTGFSSNKDDIEISIDKSNCTVLKATTTKIMCQTTKHLNSITAKVAVRIKGLGLANNTLADFTYIDVWSSRSTWGNKDPPGEGEFVIVGKGQKLLLDIDTPVLKMLLVQGGTLEFDEKDIELKAENILITDGGTFRVGSEEKPFQHKAIITLYGHLRAKELPIYGTKTLAVREGLLELHGRQLITTWTHLAATANRGDNSILLKHAVANWQIGDQIVIATTGGRHSQKENEIHTIAAISDDYRNLTLTEKLSYQHISVEEVVDGRKMEFCAEVGLLSRNVIVRGSLQNQWIEKIEACPDGFNTGEFATQTCFQGRFGDEMGSDQFGAQIMIHAPVKDKNLAIAHIAYVEVTHAGQAFRLGRYPVHFHLNGDMSKSYVRGCAIHHTFNRAINVHGTYRILIEHNVVYNIMGGAIFLEDGIETGNVFQYNLAVFVKPSTSLRNDDVTPASFWVTNPDNVVRHNAAAGGSHFGFWYRMLSHPEGPSFTYSICPRNIPLGIFYNNSAHSFGWFGLWTFPSFTPRENGRCNYWMDKRVVFEKLTAWNCEKGAETVDSGPLQMNDFVLVNNEFAGFEGKVIVRGPQYTEESMMVKNSLIVGRSSVLTSKPTQKAIVLPFGNGMIIQNVTFANFDKQSTAFALTSVDGHCVHDCGGFLYQTSALKFIKTANRAIFRWKDEMILHDLDGTLTGVAQGKVVATTGLLPPTCTKGENFSSLMPASICPPSVKFHRFAFNNIYPSNMKRRALVVTNRYGNISTPYKFKAVTHKEGWMVLLVSGLEHKISFLGASHVTNISYDASFYQFYSGGYVLITQEKDILPDRFTIDGKRTFIPRSLKMPTYEKSGTGNWFYNSEAKTMTYLVSYKASLARSKRSASLTSSKDRSLWFAAFRCFYLDCEPPKDPRLSPPAVKRPNTFHLWSVNETWSKVGKLLNSSSPTKLPTENDNVTIPQGMWVVVDVEIPKLNCLHLYGQLEISNELPKITLNVSYIYIRGGRLILGWENKHYPGEATIELRGTQGTPSLPINSGPNLGSSFIGVFGGLDLHGKERTVHWTRLASTIKVGAKILTLQKSVDWKVGEEIVVASTSYNAWETETFRISSVSVDRKTLTLNTTTLYEHIVYRENISNMTVILSAEVGLLTRNIKVIGSSYENMEREMFGARIIAGVTQTSVDSIYVGYIRLSNVEFMHTGQYGWATSSDARYSVVFHNLGTVDHKLRPTYIKNCAFHHCFSSAIGIYDSDSITVENNIIHRTIGSAIISESNNIKIRNNLITLVVCPAVYILRFNLNGGIIWPAGIESIKGENFEMSDNVVAGSERLGYHVLGEYCDRPSKWSNNYIRGALLGVGQFPRDSVKRDCALYSGFHVYRCVDAGIYNNQFSGFNLENSVFAENGVSVCPIIIEPSAVTHQTSNKKVAVRNTVFVGLTASYDCNIDRLDKTDPNIPSSEKARSGTDGRTVGLMWPTFTSGGNKAPMKPFFNIMSYPTISGLMTVENVTFAHFNHRCGNKMKTTVLMTAGFNDDGQHPVVTRNIKKTDVKSTNLVFIQRPNIRKINSADCVDMDCDGLKKALLVDKDASLIGGLAPVSVFSQSEWEWNKDKRRGIGDYRIPKVMLTSLNGSRIPVEKLAPHKGIIRNSNCIYESSWQAYKCINSSYAMLIMESLDEDTETRRLSPVAILGNGYLDLINGPQDHGWCSGYTCRKRISTFMLLVELGKTYDVYFSSTSPQNLRLHLLNTDAKIVVSIYFSRPNRLDVYDYTKTYVNPKDKRGKMPYGVSNSDKNKPVPSDPDGTNYFDPVTKRLHVTVQGGRPVDIRMTPVVVIKFSLSAISETEFFGEQLIRNLALFLEVPAFKVRIVDVVSEGSTPGSRKKRSANSGVKITTQIGDPPATTIMTNSSTTAPATVPTNNSNSSSTLSTSDLSRISSKLSNAQQLNILDKAINYSVSNMVLTPATVPVSDPMWKTQNTKASFVVKVPDRLKIVVSPEASYEGGIFKIGPCLRFYDSSGVPLEVLGTPSAPWKLKANLVFGSGSDPNAVLTGKTEISFEDGWANFTTLSISLKGTNYGLEFIVVYPAAAKFKAIVSPGLVVPRRPLTLSLISNPLKAISNKDLDLRVYLKDKVTGDIVSNSGWRGHSWNATAVLVMPFLYRGQVKNLGKFAVYNPTKNFLIFKKVSFSKAGVYILKITMTSSPEEYTIVREEDVQVMSSIPPATINTIMTLIKLIVDIDYDRIDNGNVKYFRVLMINYFMYKFPKVQFKNVAVSKSDKGKVNVHVEIYGDSDAVISASKSLCNMAENQEHVTFQSNEAYIVFSTQVNGTRYLDSNCGDLEGRIVSKNLFPPEIIIGVSFAMIFLLVVIIIFLVWRFQIVPKAKIDDSSHCGQEPPKEPVYMTRVNRSN